MKDKILSPDAVIAFAGGFILAVAACGGVYYYTNLTKELTMEAGGSFPDPSEFFVCRKNAVYTESIADVDPTEVGAHTVTIRSLLREYTVTLNIADTTPPTGEAEALTTLSGRPLEPEAFVLRANDISDVMISYETEPDFVTPGENAVGILLTDESGNTNVLETRVHVVLDTTPPVIAGVQDQKIYTGDTISYKTGITCSDDWDEEADLVLTVDNSEVDLEMPGSYTVYYRATDTSGNTAEVPAVINVVDPEQEKFELEEAASGEKAAKYAREVNASLKKEGQTSREYLEAMFWYVKKHMTYTGTSDKTREATEAVRGFEQGQGDCYTYFAMLKAMMEEAGFETRDVKRLGGTTGHYWSLVNVDGEWYHIDACARGARKFPEWICFLRTDGELEKFSTEKIKGYYTFDKTGLPATP